MDEVVAANPAAVADYRAGKAQAVGYLVGQVMKASRGQANAALVQAMLRERLGPAGRDRGGSAVNLVGVALVAGGVALLALGYARARGPWQRYQALKAQDENASRYRAWRGGPASAAEEKTGASVAMADAAPPGRTWAAVAAVGVVLVVVGRPSSSADGRSRDRRCGRLSSVPARHPKRWSSTERQRSITTPSPPARAIRAASQLTIPSWSHRTRAPAATASVACAGQSSARRNTSTMSNAPVAATAAARSG